MPIVKHFTIKDMTDLVPGELIAFDLVGPALGIASFTREETGQIKIIILKSGIESAHPCWTDLPIDGSVLSYGTEWLLDLGRADGCYPGNYESHDVPGTVAVSASHEHAMLRAAGDGQTARHRPAWFELPTARAADIAASPSSTVYIRRWSIWTDETERRRTNGSPIFTFSGGEAEVAEG